MNDEVKAAIDAAVDEIRICLEDDVPDGEAPVHYVCEGKPERCPTVRQAIERVALAALEAAISQRCAGRTCGVCWYGPECGPFYGIQRINIDEERQCPCNCHVVKGMLADAKRELEESMSKRGET